MSSERVRKLLLQLRQELDAADVDAETRALMRELDADIHMALGQSANPLGALARRAEAVEVRFAVNHRVAEKILREIIDTLAKIGV
jgi:Domain of unknown function (DUF4404)